MVSWPWIGLGRNAKSTLNASPSGSESLVNTLKVTAVPSVVVTVSATATGGRFGPTVMVKLHELELPDVSNDVQTAVVVPTGKVLPEAGEQSNEAMPQGSLAAAM